MGKALEISEMESAGLVEDEIEKILVADRIVVGVAAYPLMHDEDGVSGLAFKFDQGDGSTTVVVAPRDVCETIRQIIDDLSGLGWSLPDMVAVPGRKPN